MLHEIVDSDGDDDSFGPYAFSPDEQADQQKDEEKKEG